MNERYVWLTWSSTFLVPWTLLFLRLPHYRRAMWRASLLTALFGLTEPLFVPAYWNPPSLFDLAQTTGFDLESLIFSFAIGGVGVVLYNALTGRARVPLADGAKHQGHHRWHRLAVLAPVLVFPALYLLPWNPIYPAITAMVIGAAAAVACRPDLAANTLVGGALFLGYYVVFMALLLISAPGYVEHVWNIAQLTGVTVLGIPVEELWFGMSFGMYWSGVYEHLTWARSAGREGPTMRIGATP